MANYANHHASVIVNAPMHQVYEMFTHFNDFPAFMSFVKEVTCYGDQTSHWVANIGGQQEWDAVNVGWLPDRQIGWHSTNGLENFGKVTFEPAGQNQTKIDVDISYNPPAGVLGDIGENLGVGNRFEFRLQQDLEHFARMVNQAPVGSLDPASSSYLFHSQSAAAQGRTTDRQKESMLLESDTDQQRETGVERPIIDQDITGMSSRDLKKHAAEAEMPSAGIPGDRLPPTPDREPSSY
jgi:uncharacterized membrane protein